MKSNFLLVILGPTGSGKFNLAIKIAKKFNGQIVSADSRKVYQEMDIGTAKPYRKEIQKINLIDVVYPDQKFNAAIYKKMAVKAIKNIQKQGKLPILAGGTGLYISSIVDNLQFPKVPPQKKLRKELEKKSKEELFKICQKLDSKGAEFIDKNNKRRLIRAIEVSKFSAPFSKQRKKAKPIFDILQIGIRPSKRELEKRINKRTQKMFKNGLEKEVKNLVQKYGWEIPAMQTIGYQEWKTYFSDEKITKKQVFELIKLHTLQLAKRQMTWFKRDKRIHWLKNYRNSEVGLPNF